MKHNSIFMWTIRFRWILPVTSASTWTTFCHPADAGSMFRGTNFYLYAAKTPK